MFLALLNAMLGFIYINLYQKSSFRIVVHSNHKVNYVTFFSNKYSGTNVPQTYKHRKVLLVWLAAFTIRAGELDINDNNYSRQRFWS